MLRGLYTSVVYFFKITFKEKVVLYNWHGNGLRKYWYTSKLTIYEPGDTDKINLNPFHCPKLKIPFHLRSKNRCNTNFAYLNSCFRDTRQWNGPPRVAPQITILWAIKTGSKLRSWSILGDDVSQERYVSRLPTSSYFRVGVSVVTSQGLWSLPQGDSTSCTINLNHSLSIFTFNLNLLYQTFEQFP